MAIIDAIAEESYRKHLKSERGKRLYEQTTTKKAQALKNMLKGEECFPEENKAQTCYYEQLNSYYSKRMVVPPVSEGRSYALWHSIVVAAKRASMDVEDYIESQFKWYHKAFRKAPEPFQLRTDSAVKRAQASAEIKTKPKAGYTSDKDIAMSMGQADKTIRDLMRANNASREDVYRHLIIPGHVSIPKAFMQNDPAYKRALE